MKDDSPRCEHGVVFPDGNCINCMRKEIERLTFEVIQAQRIAIERGNMLIAANEKLLRREP